jgi:hypothetical protein
VINAGLNKGYHQQSIEMKSLTEAQLISIMTLAYNEGFDDAIDTTTRMFQSFTENMTPSIMDKIERDELFKRRIAGL